MRGADVPPQNFVEYDPEIERHRPAVNGWAGRLQARAGRCRSFVRHVVARVGLLLTSRDRGDAEILALRDQLSAARSQFIAG